MPDLIRHPVKSNCAVGGYLDSSFRWNDKEKEMTEEGWWAIEQATAWVFMPRVLKIAAYAVCG